HRRAAQARPRRGLRGRAPRVDQALVRTETDSKKQTRRRRGGERPGTGRGIHGHEGTGGVGMSMDPTVVVHPDPEVLAAAAAARLVSTLADIQARKGSASVVL